MGIIQSAVNQALGTVGLAARLSPDYETKQEKHKTEKTAEALTTQLHTQEAALKTNPELTKDILEDMEATVETGLGATFKRFQLDPSEKNYEKFIKNRDFANSVLTDYQKEYQKQVEAVEKAEADKKLKAEQIRKTKEFEKKFMEGVITMRTRKEEVK